MNAEGVNRLTLLHWAFACANLEAFQLLLESGANPDIPLKNGVKSKDVIVFYKGDSILHTAARQDWFYDYLMAALKYCRSPNRVGACNHTLFYLVAGNTCISSEVLRELLKAGAHPHALGRQSAYIPALIQNNCEAIRVLRAFNVDPCLGKVSISRTVEMVDELLKEYRLKDASDEVKILEEFKVAVMKCGQNSN